MFLSDLSLSATNASMSPTVIPGTVRRCAPPLSSKLPLIDHPALRLWEDKRNATFLESRINPKSFESALGERNFLAEKIPAN